MEEDHVAHHALGIEHAGQEVATELTVQLGGAGHGVSAIDTELAFNFVSREVKRAEVGVRVSSGGGPGSTAEFSIETHLLPFVLELYRFCAGRWHVTDKSTLPSRIGFEFSLCPQALKRTVIAVRPSFTRPLLIALKTLLVVATYLATACTRMPLTLAL